MLAFFRFAVESCHLIDTIQKDIYYQYHQIASFDEETYVGAGSAPPIAKNRQKERKRNGYSRLRESTKSMIYGTK